MAIIWGAATGSNADHVNVWIEWWEGTIDYANNRSYVYARFYAQTKPTASSTTYDNNGGDSNFYINGLRVSGIVNGLIDFRSASPYIRPLNVLGTWEGWAGRDGAGNASITFSGNFSLSSSYISGGSAAGTVGLTTIWTGASAPSNPRFDQSVFEPSLTFRWNAGAGGVNNAILTYHVYYRLNYGGENPVDVGNVTSWALNGSGLARGTVVDFHVAAVTQKGDNPWSGWSAIATKNRVPYTPAIGALAKSVYIPGEVVRVNFTNSGDPDNNLSGFEAATSANETIVGTNPSSGASYVDVPTTGWIPGVSYSFRVRAYDAFGVRGAWSSYVSALVGLPMKIVTAEGGPAKQVAQIKALTVQGGTFKTVKGMKIATAQGSEFKTVFLGG